MYDADSTYGCYFQHTHIGNGTELNENEMTTVRHIVSGLKKEFHDSHTFTPSKCIVMQTPHTLKIVSFGGSITGAKYCSIIDRPLFSSSSKEAIIYGDRINNPGNKSPFWHLVSFSTDECVSYLTGVIASSKNDLEALDPYLGQRDLRNCDHPSELLDVAIYKMLIMMPEEAICWLTKLEEFNVIYDWQKLPKKDGIELKKIMLEQGEDHAKSWILERENATRTMFGL